MEPNIKDGVKETIRDKMKEWMIYMLEPEFYEPVVELLGPFGFLAGIFLAMIESFIPPLPLAAFVTINVIIYGYFLGYILSYLGTVIGSYCVFLLLKKYGSKYMQRYIQKHHKAQSLFAWIHERGVMPLIVLLTFPFTPSIIVGGLAAFASIRPKDYLLAVTLGKFFMVLSLTIIGVNIQSFFEQPLRSLGFIGLVLAIPFVAKHLLALYERKVLRHRIK